MVNITQLNYIFDSCHLLWLVCSVARFEKLKERLEIIRKTDSFDEGLHLW